MWFVSFLAEYSVDVVDRAVDVIFVATPVVARSFSGAVEGVKSNASGEQGGTSSLPRVTGWIRLRIRPSCRWSYGR